MIVRCAYLEGDVEPQNRARFDAFMVEKALPLLKRYPDVQSVRIMRAITVEEGGPQIYMIFESVYASLADMEFALTQPIRLEFKATMKEIMPLFSGRLFHINQELLADEAAA